MDFWPECLASSWGREFVAGGFGGMPDIIAGYPLDTLRIRQQSSNSGSALSILRIMVTTEGPVRSTEAWERQWHQSPSRMPWFSKYMPFCRQHWTFLFLSTILHPTSVALGGVSTGAIQSILLSHVELVKIRLHLQSRGPIPHHPTTSSQRGPISVAKSIWRTEGLRGMYKGFTITAHRDVPAYGFYFWTYECTREKLHPGCRKRGNESLRTMLVAGGLAGVASWVSCYPLDVLTTRLQAQSASSPLKYNSVVDCLGKSVKQDGHGVLCRGLRTAVARAFVVNGAVFAACETTLRSLFNNGSIQKEKTI